MISTRSGMRIMLVNARRNLITCRFPIRDLTEARYWESRQKIMVGELQHRVKNLLANFIAGRKPNAAASHHP